MLRAVISTADPAEVSDEALVLRAKESPGLDGRDLVREVSCAKPYDWDEPAWHHEQDTPKNRPVAHHVVAYDFGVKRNILRQLASAGCRVTVVPADTRAEDVLALDPDGVFLSNGPGDPAAVDYAARNTAALIESGDDKNASPVRMAMIGIDQVLHGDRDPTNSPVELTFFNLKNLEAADKDRGINMLPSVANVTGVTAPDSSTVVVRFKSLTPIIT